MMHEYLNFSKNYEAMYYNIIKLGRKYLKNNSLESMVIGISGGIDSALTTILANEIATELNIKLIGITIPIESNTKESKRAEKVAQSFCTKYCGKISLHHAYYSVCNNLYMDSEINSDTFETRVRKGNIKARLRMIQLFNLAHEHSGLVLSTDNFTEYLLGFWTLHGDVGNLGLIQNLWKTEVYGLSKWILNNKLKTPQEKEALNLCINATPTDGLGVSESDFAQLGCDSYEEIDYILLTFLQRGKVLNNQIIKRHLTTNYKRYDPYNLRRLSILGVE